MDDKIKEVMGLVIDVSCAGIEYGEAKAGEDAASKLLALHIAEQAIESKLRELVPVWLPIESAPKGKTFLVRGGKWHGEISDPSPSDIAFVSYDGRQFSEAGGDYYSSWIQDPTHWMPLP